MIVDVHTHLMWYPDHIAERFAQEALASKLVKLRTSGGAAYAANLDLHSYDSTPMTHWAASSTADRVVVFGLQAKATGVWVPNALVAAYVSEHPDKLVGWASVDPTQADAIDQLRHAVDGLGLRGLKLGPAYQHFDPTDRTFWPFFAEVERLGIPTLWHQGTTFPSQARLRISTPLALEDLAMDFPGMRMIVAHLGHPWEEDLVALVRKAPNVWADISACHYRPWRYWQAMATAWEYGVSHKLLLASDFPSGTIDHVIEGLRRVNDPVEGTRLTRIPEDAIERIIHENWREALPEWA
jgi:predicted TIM-barrel fold metal-dependent hydrolase